MIDCDVDGKISEDIPCGIRLQVSFCMGSEVSVSDIGRRDSRGVEKDIRTTLQLERDSNHRGSDSI